MAAKTNKQLRRFAMIVALGLAVVASISWYRGHTSVPYVLWSGAALLLLLGLVYPPALGPVEKGWMKFGHVLGWINTRIILTVLFALVVTPIGAVARLFRDPLDRRLNDDKPTYWLPKKSGPGRPEAYERQF
jgi:hypothetical protein